MNSTQQTKTDEYTKLNFGRKAGYACGDFACNMSWSLIGSYLVFFLTDVALINATVVGAVIFISKFWDAVNDPVVGSLADKTHSRWGRYRPWVIFAFIPMLIFNVLTFTTNLNWSEGFRTFWGLGMYFILVLLYTMVNVTYSGHDDQGYRDEKCTFQLSYDRRFSGHDDSVGSDASYCECDRRRCSRISESGTDLLSAGSSVFRHYDSLNQRDRTGG